MPFRTLILPLALLLLPLSSQAQQADTPPEQEAAVVEQDVGTLQAELAKVEAERQRLADELANTADHAEVEQLSRQNLALRDRLSVMEKVADTNQAEEQRKWFIVGGATVAGSLILGWLLAQLGGRRKRNEWTN
ncbi:hypothetical protein [Pseudomonas sp. FME51]|uniref:hypothetical protein n=1 Tax=Pseudomonas sp. FME51 TaxID=2742609 RepID=UPI00186632A2|nr:hypothetical protein [Pseudomonas sp. FME51]